MIIKQFTSYTVEHNTRNQGTEPNLFSKPTWKIYLRVGATVIAVMQFFDEEPVLPCRGSTTSTIVLPFHISRFDDIIKTLRYEKPLYLWFNDLVPSHNKTGGIRTYPEDEEPGVGPGEPVGEEES